MNKRPPKINAHCHLLCLEFVPNKMTEELALPEMLVGSFVMKKLAGAVKRRGAEFLGAFSEKIKCKDNVDDCYKNSVDKNHNCDGCFGEVIANFIYKNGDYLTSRAVKSKGDEINPDDKRFDIYTPLMMDLEWGANSSDKSFKGMVRYEDQVHFISEQVKRFPFRIFPFIMFDPRRENSYELCKKAIDELGFLGIKMYPPLGYFPNPSNYEYLNSKSKYYDTEKRDKLRKMATGDGEDNDSLLKDMDDRLEKLYRYCEDNNVPITTHAGSSGAYDIDMTQGQANIFANINNWQAVLEKHPNLKLNFAHLGGNYIKTTDEAVKIQAEIWRQKIISLLKNYPAVYADVSYHNMGLESTSFGEKEYHMDQVGIEKYYFELKEILTDKTLSEKVIFGTDTPMITHSWSEKDYFDQFVKNIKGNLFVSLVTKNPTRFLFGESGEIPVEYVDFVRKHNPEMLEEHKLPEWVREDSGRYFIVN